jgi:flagellar M-ring protein FliF
LVFAIFIAILIGGYFLIFRQDYVVLHDGLDPAEASAIVAELDRQKTPYRLAEGGAQILVRAQEADAVRLSIAGANIPIQGVEGFELFNESDMGLTDFAQKIKYQRALQGELARTIMMMEGVAEARVHISMPERTLFRGEADAARAAVTVVFRAAEEETPARIEGIQRLVSASVAGLSVADVVVLNNRGEPISPRAEIVRLAPNAPPGAATEAALREAMFAAVRRAIPDEHFDLGVEEVIETLTPPGEPSAIVGESPPPAPVTIRVRAIRILTVAPLPATAEDRVRAELRAAGLVELPLAQTVLFQTGLAPAATTPDAHSPAAPEARAIPVEARAGDDAQAWLGDKPVTLVIGLCLLALLAGVAAFAFRKSPRALLSDDSRRQFAEQLRLGLQSESPDAGHG